MANVKAFEKLCLAYREFTQKSYLQSWVMTPNTPQYEFARISVLGQACLKIVKSCDDEEKRDKLIGVSQNILRLSLASARLFEKYMLETFPDQSNMERRKVLVGYKTEFEAYIPELLTGILSVISAEELLDNVSYEEVQRVQSLIKDLDSYNAKAELGIFSTDNQETARKATDELVKSALKAKKVVEASTKAAEQTGIINSGQAFSDQAGRHEKQSKFWFKVICCCVAAIIGMLGMFLLFGCYPLSSEKIQTHISDYPKFAKWDLYVFIGCRLGIMISLFWALGFSSKNYSHHRNKISENMHRHNIMATYLASIADLPNDQKAVVARIAFSATFLNHPEIPEKEDSESLIKAIKDKIS